jgi:hypothetical protein
MISQQRSKTAWRSAMSTIPDRLHVAGGPESPAQCRNL